jgi:hypothetical protein
MLKFAKKMNTVVALETSKTWPKIMILFLLGQVAFTLSFATMIIVGALIWDTHGPALFAVSVVMGAFFILCFIVDTIGKIFVLRRFYQSGEFTC